MCGVADAAWTAADNNGATASTHRSPRETHETHATSGGGRRHQQPAQSHGQTTPQPHDATGSTTAR